MLRLLSTLEVARLTEIRQPTILLWVRKGYLAPEFRGHQNRSFLFSYQQALALGWISALHKAGRMTLPMVEDITEAFNRCTWEQIEKWLEPYIRPNVSPLDSLRRAGGDNVPPWVRHNLTDEMIDHWTRTFIGLFKELQRRRLVKEKKQVEKVS